jgi:membrane-associated protease RseP (regulator of RpoE activity)
MPTAPEPPVPDDRAEGAPLDPEAPAHRAEGAPLDPEAPAHRAEGAPPAPADGAPPPETDGEPPAGAGALRWKWNLALFVLTVASVHVTGGATFAVALLGILLTHEFGHYFAARWHGVPASLPYFIPLPLLSPFGTMGAVISMPERIRSRNALLDIGASGPLAGLLVALPVLVVGLYQSPVQPITGEGLQEGQSLLYLLLKRVVLGPIPVGHDVFLTPLAFAGWSGLFVTALNLIPIGQLDGGHVLYALLGPRANRVARALHWGLLLAFVANLAAFELPVVRHHGSAAVLDALRHASSPVWGDLLKGVTNSMFWLMWFGVLHLLRRMTGGYHPPTEGGELTPARRAVAILSLVLFALLFMPTPMSSY